MTSTKAAALTATCALLLTACNPAANRDSHGPTDSAAPPAGFSKQVSGTLRTSGYNPSDEVGKARGEHATGQIAPATVDMDTTKFDAQKFVAQVASGQTPDLIQVERGAVGTLADKGLIVPIDECLALWGVRPETYFYRAAIDDVTHAGKVYAVPQFFQPSLIIANRRVMQSTGVGMGQLDTSNPDQVVAAAGRMSQSGVPVGVDADLPGSAALWLTVFGGRAHDAEGRPTLDDPANVEALTWMKQLMDAQGGYAKVKSSKDAMDTFGDENQYVKDQVGAQTWGQWYINVLSSTKDRVSVEAAPIKDRSGRPLGFAGGSALAIPRSGKNPSAACAWAVQVTSPEAWDAAAAARTATVQKKNGLFTGLFTGSPIADKAIREKYVRPGAGADFDQLIATSYAALDNTASIGGSAIGQQLTDLLGNAVTVTLNGEKAPQMALREAQDAALRAWEQSTIGKKR